MAQRVKIKSITSPVCAVRDSPDPGVKQVEKSIAISQNLKVCNESIMFTAQQGRVVCCVASCEPFLPSDINECASSPCENSATCVDDVSGYFCDCLAGYTGQHCQTGCSLKSV